jgi:hypothetical protein
MKCGKEEAMSVINVLAIENVLFFPRTCYECIRIEAKKGISPIPVTLTPPVSPRWSVEIDSDGKRHLVEHWYAGVNAE